MQRGLGGFPHERLHQDKVIFWFHGFILDSVYFHFWWLCGLK
ncbi:hypothetical protein [Moorena producens]